MGSVVGHSGRMQSADDDDDGGDVLVSRWQLGNEGELKEEREEA